MPTTVVGFQLGNDDKHRQVTVVLTATGVLHRAHGAPGRLPRMPRPDVPFQLTHPDRGWAKTESPLARPILSLRELHTSWTKKGYTHPLVPPACVRLDVEEHPVVKGQYGTARPHPELARAFLSAAPSNTQQSLDEAIHDFRTALGLPTRPKSVLWRPRRSPVPPRTEAMLRTLAHGSQINSPQRLAVGWSVSPQAVTLRVGRTGETLDRPAVLELQAALTAWLRLTQPPSP
ncbi:hypothetical protein OOK31_36615 [Streptomyces sp. NBC_00249]|uniref:hypothetical protein n=1 Tax=Streptomyces sp. NBC_00249 TaxID=2975690 RepID=UPI00225283FE|nr:hypothetical protein [Streptomyces sp. NBC_00249]MCX5199337.1 hypothetical protein [Streptomyces sp. NBC_00249]